MASMTSYPAGDHVAITRTFVQGTTTTAIDLIGQVLNNGKTNWVGYGEASAYYILPSSVANAEATSLADGMTYYYSEGKAPAGYLATGGSASGSSAATATASSTSGTGAAAMSTSAAASSSTTGSAAASTPRLSKAGAFSLVLSLLTVFSFNMII